MNYALIENSIVTNVIWLYEGNASDFQNAVRLGDRPVGIGDSYIEGKFYRDGVELLTPLERSENSVAQLDSRIVELEYNNILLEYGIE